MKNIVNILDKLEIAEDLSFSAIKWTASNWPRWGAVSSGVWRSGSDSGKGSSSPNGEGFSCQACGRVYKLKSSLRNHTKWECGKDPQFQCPHCVYRAKQKMHIARHMERMHKDKRYQEEVVQRSSNYIKVRAFFSKEDDSYKIQIPCPISERPFNCNQCGKSYAWKISLNRHLREECGQMPKHSCYSDAETNAKTWGRHMCQNCGKGYKWLQSLVRHKREECCKEPQHPCPIYHNEMDIIDECKFIIVPFGLKASNITNPNRNEVILNPVNLFEEANSSRGYTTAIEDQQFLCGECGKGYKWMDNLRRHQRLHCGKKKNLFCPHCPKAFYRKYEWKNHLASKHNEYYVENSK
ncbi:zinc finger protein 726-like [Leptopilina boulardi]|uniref:zinc finger protein 726-like n=1 Tax=Leptopilina boulardi TaxID=63433 RepID=UPI0021F5AC12|nr:zinc finger protein 726-like [Leptopilina boulardi]